MSQPVLQAIKEPLADQIGDFLLRKRRKSTATYDLYRLVLERIFLPWCGSCGITEASEADDRAMERFTDSLLRRPRPLTVPTIRTYVRHVRMFLTWAKVPRGDYEQLPEPERMRNPLTRQEIDRMERTATAERDRLIVRVLADTGVRVSELLGLREQDLRANGYKYFIRVIGKNNREREVGVPEPLYRRLRRFARDGEREYIFNAKQREHRLTRHGLEQLIRKLAKEAKIERRVWPHLFRHGYITQMARKKVPLQDVMKAVGHKTPAMTMLIYNHTTADDSYDALMDALK